MSKQLSEDQQETWDALTDGCEHKELVFGSGDYYIFCGECGRSWIMEDNWKHNIGRGSQLSGEKRIKPNGE